MSEALESMSGALASSCAALVRVDGAPRPRHPSGVELEPLPTLSVRVERRRAALSVIASSGDHEPSLQIEAVFSGGPDGMWFRLTQAGGSRVFSRDAIARHPALSAVLRLIADEVDTTQPLREALLPFLFRSLLVYARRMSTPVPLPHWGRPLRDARVERALELLNRDIAKRWTVALLARAVGLSRPAFARQFLRVLGLTPMRYLTERRMQAAAAMLLGSDAGLAEVAREVGYRSEFAFNRAFKKHFQVPPGVYRQFHTPLPAAVSPLSALTRSTRPVALRLAA
jgi:AraC-like DNA-binding protein